MAQRVAVGGSADKLVSAGNQALVDARLAQAQGGEVHIPQGTVHAERMRTEGFAHGAHHAGGQVGGRVQAADAQPRQLVAREQGRGVHVVLHERIGHDHVAHPHVGAQAARHAGEDDLLAGHLGEQHGGGGGRRDLADAREHGHDVAPLQVAHPEGASGTLDGFGVEHGVEQGLEFFREGGDHANAARGRQHGKMKQTTRRSSSPHSRPRRQSSPSLLSTFA